MSSFVSVELDKSSLQKTKDALKRFDKESEKVIKSVVDRTALAVSTDAQEKLKSNKHIRTNRLRASIHPEYKPNEGGHGEDSLKGENFGKLEAITGTNVVYAGAMEFGSKPHIIEPKRKKFLHFFIGDMEVFTKKVKHPGYKGDSFLRWAAEKQKPLFVKRMEEALNKLINGSHA